MSETSKANNYFVRPWDQAFQWRVSFTLWHHLLAALVHFSSFTDFTSPGRRFLTWTFTIAASRAASRERPWEQHSQSRWTSSYWPCLWTPARRAASGPSFPPETCSFPPPSSSPASLAPTPPSSAAPPGPGKRSTRLCGLFFVELHLYLYRGNHKDCGSRYREDCGLCDYRKNWDIRRVLLLLLLFLMILCKAPWAEILVWNVLYK